MPTYYLPQGDDEPRRFSVETLTDGSYRVTKPDGEVWTVEASTPEAHLLNLRLEGKVVEAAVQAVETEWLVHLLGESHHLEVLNERRMRMRTAGVSKRGAAGPDLTSPMAGKVVAVLVEPGQRVEMNEAVLVIEAMKMENEIKAHRAGHVDALHAQLGAAVEIGDVLVSIDDLES